MKSKLKPEVIVIIAMLVVIALAGTAWFISGYVQTKRGIEEITKAYDAIADMADSIENAYSPATPAPDDPNKLTIIPGENNMIDPLIPALDELFVEADYTARVEGNKIVTRVTVPDIAATAAAAEDSGDVSAWLELLDDYTEYNNSVAAIASENSINYPAVLYGIDAEENIYFTISGSSVAYTAVDVTPKSSASPDDYNVGTRGEPTLGEENALEKALSYLDVLPFSYEGLIEQLEFEGYTHSEAVYGAANCGADWYEQAYRKAQSYLDVLAFSRSGLIEQLEFEGFTTSEAEYAADMVGY